MENLQSVHVQNSVPQEVTPIKKELGNPLFHRLYTIAGLVGESEGAKARIQLCVRRCFYIDDFSGEWQGKVRLFYGARTGLELLYLNDENADLATYYEKKTFKAVEAILPLPSASSYSVITMMMTYLALLQGTFTPFVHAHVGRTQITALDFCSATFRKTSEFRRYAMSKTGGGNES